MRLPLLLCLATLATSSFSTEPETDLTRELSITYRVLEVFPQGRRVAITCHTQVSPPVTYTLWGSRDIEVSKKVVSTRDPVSFHINVTLKSRPDLLTYTCQASTAWGMRLASAPLQLYWELWAKPVSQLQADFTVLDREAGPRLEMSCQAASGSPPITYSLVGRDGHVHMRQTPQYGQPANFSFPLTQTPAWLQCQAQNGVSVQSSPLTLVPPGQLPKAPTFVLAASLASIAAITSGMLGWTRWTR
ncbi:protein IL-40 [Eptesicus fuscus]|uniref:protein IL-40 n=1 Tax=Eptesicus fuscus TaxID=29078 RepID=UPI002403D468|nr:protein IL-40 [Eptesicus fuscus]